MYNSGMQIIKKIAQPLLYGSIALFMVAGKFDGLWLYWVAAAAMAAGMVLFVASAVLPDEKTGRSAGEPPQASTPRSAHSGLPRSVPRPSGVQVKDEVPAWAYITAFLMSLGGLLSFLFGPNGISPRTVISFGLIPGGLVFFLAAKAAYGGAIGLRNVLRGLVAFLGFLLLFAGIMGGVLIFAGFFSREHKVFYAVGAAAALLAGAGLTYYGMKYQQGPEGVAIGRELGFQDAGGDDGVYDSKGAMNGVELMFNVEQTAAHSTRHASYPAHFRLEVLCACANPRGLRLEIQPEGFLNFSFSGLPKAPHVDYWDNYEIRANLPDVAVGPLAAAKAGENVFGEQAGFSSLTVDGNELKLVFELEGYAGTAYVRRVLDEASRLAAAFS